MAGKSENHHKRSPDMRFMTPKKVFPSKETLFWFPDQSKSRISKTAETPQQILDRIRRPFKSERITPNLEKKVDGAMGTGELANLAFRLLFDRLFRENSKNTIIYYVGDGSADMKIEQHVFIGEEDTGLEVVLTKKMNIDPNADDGRKLAFTIDIFSSNRNKDHICHYRSLAGDHFVRRLDRDVDNFRDLVRDGKNLREVREDEVRDLYEFIRRGTSMKYEVIKNEE